MTKKIIKSGDDSINVQAEHATTTFISGIDEKRVREVFHELFLQLKDTYTQEAITIANDRITSFENKLISKMESVDGAWEMFADPSFQLVLAEAQKTAAATELEDDHDILSELLLHRFEKKDCRPSKAAIKRAIQIVDEISEEALVGLTAYHCLDISLNNGCLKNLLDQLNELFGTILLTSLPLGTEWLDHSDILRTVRSTPLMSFTEFEEFSYIKYAYQINLGIKKDSEKYYKALNLTREHNLPNSLLEDNLLNEHFVKMNCYPNMLTGIRFCNVDSKGKQNQIAPTKTQLEAMKSIYELYADDSSTKEEALEIFLTEWNKRPYLKQVKEWREQLPFAFGLTSIGTTLAHSNLQRINSDIPPLKKI